MPCKVEVSPPLIRSLFANSVREEQARIHAVGIALQRRVEELLNLGKFHNFIELALYLSLLHSSAFKVHTDWLWYNSQ
jgi:hypothetical protein